MNAFVPHLETLPDAQRDLLPKLRNVCELGYTLYGGTALVLRLGHRESVDFDFFSDAPLDRKAIERLEVFGPSSIFQDEPDALGFLVGADADAVKISLFGKISFGRVGEPDRTADGNLVVASIDDLFATKLKVLLQRIEAKDYLDIVALLESGATLERGLAAARSLFGSAFAPAESLRALTYFEEGDLRALRADQRTFLETKVAACRTLPVLPIVSRRLNG